MQRLISEIYSPLRVTAEIRRTQNKQSLSAFATHLTTVEPSKGTPWDFSSKNVQDKAKNVLRSQKPYLYNNLAGDKDFGRGS